MSDPAVTLPPFFTTGLAVQVAAQGGITCNAPGYHHFEPLSTTDKVAQFFLTHYHPQAAHDQQVIDEFDQDCIATLFTDGGIIPHETVKDWLYFRGFKNDLVLA
ncbi:MAG: hypothetical protein ACI9FJ_000644 [Alteromonadaceae bacterium]|jgi:hypothetical protein